MMIEVGRDYKAVGRDTIFPCIRSVFQYDYI